MIELKQGDCLELMKDIPGGSIDLILQDPPYNTTACHWEWDIMTVIDELWSEWKRIIKPNGAIVMFGSQPFTSKLIASNYKMFKYEWIWQKGRASGFLHAKNKPLKAHENIIVFSNGTTVHQSQSNSRMIYNPQMGTGTSYVSKATNKKNGKLLHKPLKCDLAYVGTVVVNEGTRYPRSVLNFKNPNVGNISPTQKPVPLLEYLIKTYTNEGETVFDGFAGSASTGVACINTNRNFIGIEKDEKYFKLATERLNNATLPVF